MREADRILRERERRAAAQRAQESASATERAQRLEADQVRTIRSETAAVLQLLKKRQYPDMIGVTIEQPRFGLMYGSLGYKRVRLGGWKIGTYNGEIHGDSFVGEIFLLSDGRFNLQGGHGSLAARDLEDTFLRRHLASVLRGIQSFRRQLEGGSQIRD